MTKTVKGEWIVLRHGDALEDTNFDDCIIERVKGNPMVRLSGCNFVDCTFVGFGNHPFATSANLAEIISAGLATTRREPEVVRAKRRKG